MTDPQIKKFTDLVANTDTNLAAAAVGDYILIYDISEPLDINKIKVITTADYLKLATETGRQALVTGQAAGDLFYGSASDALARLAKPSVDAILKNTSAGVPSWAALSSLFNATNRKGGSATDWSAAGTTDYALTTQPFIQCGTFEVAISGTNSAQVWVNFPVAFSVNNPLVIVGAPVLVLSAVKYWVQLNYSGATQFGVTVYRDVTTAQTFRFPWFAIGPAA